MKYCQDQTKKAGEVPIGDRDKWKAATSDNERKSSTDRKTKRKRVKI